jgi:hypothetical protein
LDVALYWQAVAPVEEDAAVFNHLFGLDGAIIGQADGPPDVPTSQWLPAQVVTTTHHMQTDPGLPVPALATLDVGLYRSDGDRKALPAADRKGQKVPVTAARLKFVPATWPDQPPPVVTNASFGENLLLRGHSILPDTIRLQASRSFALLLWWEAVATVNADYTVFVHLVDMADNVVAQADGVPMSGRYPTSAWGVGEHIIDERPMTLPIGLPQGRYRLIIGLYNPLDGSRLRLAGEGTDFVLLGTIQVE